MKIRGSCECRGEVANEELFRSYLFKVIQLTNSYKKERWVIVKNGYITDVQKELVTNERIIAKIKVGQKLAKVKLLFRPF